MHHTTIPAEPADALDQAANGLAEAIATDFGGKPPVPAQPARPSVWTRWLRSRTVDSDTDYKITVGAPRGIARPAQ